MKRKIVWLVISCLMVLSLVLASCSPAEEVEEEVTPPPAEEEEVAPEEEEMPPEGPEMVKVRAVKTDGTVVEKLVEKPKYGGVFVAARSTSPLSFDGTLAQRGLNITLLLTNEMLNRGDWAKGPAGTDEATWLYVIFPPAHVTTGELAESWELVDPQTFVFHIRKGVHFHNKPPTNGREMTADDVVFSFIRVYESDKAMRGTMEGIESITAPDKWTVVFKVSDPDTAGAAFEACSQHISIVPKEAVEMYGDLGDWENSVGTGAFMLTDYVTDSSITYERNPNYWGKHPLHPEDTMPYLDGVKSLIIPDLSTRMAAIRTARVDWIPGLLWEEAEGLLKTSSELKYLKWHPGTCSAIYWRVDKPELPWYDVKVRQALAMAIDNQAILDGLYGGEGELLSWPMSNLKEFSDMYIPLSELPESVREQFEYHPDKARQLLAEAGYPDGFKTKVVSYATQVDLLAIVKDYWEDVGVEMEIDVKEYGTWLSILYGRSYDMASYVLWGYFPFQRYFSQSEMYWNMSGINDPLIDEIQEQCMIEYYFDEPKRRELAKSAHPHMLEQAYYFQFPTPYVYNFWQPWVKGYHGEYLVGFVHEMNFPMYIWLDQDLKEAMTGRR